MKSMFSLAYVGLPTAICPTPSALIQPSNYASKTSKFVNKRIED